MSEETLVEKYFILAKKLEKTYPETEFKDHCFWRIALDNTLKNQWNEVIERPAYEHLSLIQLQKVIHKLESYLKDKGLLLDDNQRSLNYRRLQEQI